ncbi:hypothetical protein N7468_004170 [Penicillium chermesinum]|uniref:[histone H3]-dimethyl-L-lysine(36) demethylase n=1 Tax=Penicillium chermesinum TaxID=63820 RepID=A0A9W9P7T2_9EURO|nr:uncharacterized protein N7468_004170 [Penicillium chermesinum]KAJ5239551.1 hypothetical protein N7468_004170 [Penicillium chermesinum]
MASTTIQAKCDFCQKTLSKKSLWRHRKNCPNNKPLAPTFPPATFKPEPSITITSFTDKDRKAVDTQAFIQTIDRACVVDDSAISQTSCLQELHDLLSKPYTKPILWRGFTKHYPLPGTPSSISEFLEALKRYQIKELDVYDYMSNTDLNYKVSLDKIIEHFAKPPGSVHPLNFLDIRNYFASAIPPPIFKADILQLAWRRQEESVSKSIPQKFPLDHADREFYLLSTQGSVSTIHADTAGVHTFISIITGSKYWYIPRQLGLVTSQTLASFGSSTPEVYQYGWIKIKLSPGDLLIMPPGCPHAVFTPENTLAFGGTFYTLPSLGDSIRALSLQIKTGDTFSNEDLSEQDYSNFVLMLSRCRDLLTPTQSASISMGADWQVQDGSDWHATGQRNILSLAEEINCDLEKRFNLSSESLLQ